MKHCNAYILLFGASVLCQIWTNQTTSTSYILLMTVSQVRIQITTETQSSHTMLITELPTTTVSVLDTIEPSVNTDSVHVEVEERPTTPTFIPSKIEEESKQLEPFKFPISTETSFTIPISTETSDSSIIIPSDRALPTTNIPFPTSSPKENNHFLGIFLGLGALFLLCIGICGAYVGWTNKKKNKAKVGLNGLSHDNQRSSYSQHSQLMGYPMYKAGQSIPRREYEMDLNYDPNHFNQYQQHVDYIPQDQIYYGEVTNQFQDDNSYYYAGEFDDSSYNMRYQLPSYSMFPYMERPLNQESLHSFPSPPTTNRQQDRSFSLNSEIEYYGQAYPPQFYC
jgi:hypothetical protein